ncbi:hypothetical protein MS3_00002021 [Schistosoma haematobium]|uniref:Uncharacterized protein n=1 Tax=Schistosoma haematobium TaxID=6185 RepID=A0A922LYW6_SCHHA|nr:hypothetical protein MS3_00002021 [Schistosoma haematobium]KAH9596303.1 hypothetical protein MS3_00002021 [Schistosoma haematobium]
MSTCIFWMMAFVVLQVFASYSRTILTFVLKILTLVLVDNRFEFEMFFSCKYATLALPIRAFTSASDLPCSSIMLPITYVKVFTSSKCYPSSVIGLLHAELYWRFLLSRLCMLRPTSASAAVAAEATALLVVFSCICCYVCGRRGRSSANCRSFSWIVAVHFIPCFPSDVDVFMIQSITRRKWKSESKQPCLTPVFTSNECVKCPPCTISFNP